jgi:hypothetical protein|tara:strand:- start:2413 stop:2637 length:225 start_codon:yes stop_codon:yes gene_type:complete
MKYTTNTFRPAANWITTGVLTLFICCFGIIAQTQASEPHISLADFSASFTSFAQRLLPACEDEAHAVTGNFYLQ